MNFRIRTRSQPKCIRSGNNYCTDKLGFALHSVADPYPGSGAFKTLGSGIRDGQKIRIRIRDEQPGSY
jgi:hypothetical protein